MFDFSSGLLGDKDALLAIAAQLMQARKGQELPALGQGLLAGIQARNMGEDRRQKGLLQQQQVEHGQMQMDAMRRQAEQQRKLEEAYTRNVRPGAPTMLPTDMETPSGPAGPSGLNMQGYQNDLLAAGPAGFAEYAKLQQLNKPDLVPLKPGESLVDKRNPTKALFTNQANEWETVGRDEKTQQWIQKNKLTGEIKAVGSMPHQINLSTNMPPLEKREQGDKGALNVKNYSDIQGTAAAARKENAVLSGLEKIDLDTGKTTPANATVSAWIASLGGGQRFQELASKGQAFTGFATELVLQKQLAQKGPQTESDARRLEQTVASLGNTPEANRLLITFSKAANNRAIEQDKFYRDYWAKHKTYEGADTAWDNSKGSISIWEEPALKKYQSRPSGVLRFDSMGNQIQ